MPSLTLKAPPRGLVHFKGAGPQTLAGVLIALAISGYLLWQDLALFQAWADLFSGLASLGGLQAGVALSRAPDLLANVQSSYQPAAMGWSVATALGCAALLWASSLLLHKDSVPGIYGLRALALVLALPAAGYLVTGSQPDLGVNAHVAGVFKLGYWTMVLAPVIFAITGFTLPGNVAKKVGWLVLCELYFTLSVPLLALLHLEVLRLLGLAWAPLLNTGFSVLLLSVHVIAFYSLIASTQD